VLQGSRDTGTDVDRRRWWDGKRVEPSCSPAAPLACSSWSSPSIVSSAGMISFFCGIDRPP